MSAIITFFLPSVKRMLASDSFCRPFHGEKLCTLSRLISLYLLFDAREIRALFAQFPMFPRLSPYLPPARAFPPAQSQSRGTSAVAKAIDLREWRGSRVGRGLMSPPGVALQDIGSVRCSTDREPVVRVLRSPRDFRIRPPSLI